VTGKHVAQPAGERRRVAVLISGRGSNMVALAKAAEGADCPYRIVSVIANRPDATGLATAQGFGISTALVDHKTFASREDFERVLDERIRDVGAQYVVLAGFMRVLTPWFIARWTGRLINIHPSLLPSFKGIRTHEQALEAGVKIHGCTVHYVVPELDAGPIIAQVAVPVLQGDDANILAARVLAQEHHLYPAALARVVTGGAALVDGRVISASATSADHSKALFSPMLP
jgi:phosphoribosylglycinamide formyltransferase 1